MSIRCFPKALYSLFQGSKCDPTVSLFTTLVQLVQLKEKLIRTAGDYRAKP